MGDYAISTWILKNASFTEALSALDGAGFDKIELSGSGSSLLAEWRNNPREAVRRLASIGLSVPSVHCEKEGRNLDSPVDEERRAAVEANADNFRRMRDCGIGEMVIHPCGKKSEAGEEARRFVRSKDSLARLAENALKTGIRIAVENTQEPSCPASAVSGLLELIEGLGGHVGLCLDVGHSALAGLNPELESAAALESGRLFSMHLHDVGPGRLEHILPGEGCLKLEAIAGELNRAGFAGLRTIELKPFSGDIAARIAAAAEVCRYWNGL